MRSAVIDADGHILERQEDIRKYLESPWDRRKTPLLPPTYPWDYELFDTLRYPNYPSTGLTPEQQVEIWLEVMDRENVETAVLFPTGSGGVGFMHEPEFAVAVARAANTHFAEEYAKRSLKLRPVGVLPLRFPEAAALELRRSVEELGLVSFELLTTGLPLALGDPFYYPIYEEAERLGVPICVHGTRSRYEDVGADRFKTFAEVHCYAFTASLLLQFTSILFNAVPLRFPNLKIAFLEIGATWLPYYLTRMDEHWKLRGEHETPFLTKKPSDVFREKEIYVSLEADEPLLHQTLEMYGDDHFIFASDFPHWDAEFPDNIRAIEDSATLSEDAKLKILYGNAKRLFNL